MSCREFLFMFYKIGKAKLDQRLMDHKRTESRISERKCRFNAKLCKAAPAKVGVNWDDEDLTRERGVWWCRPTTERERERERVRSRERDPRRRAYAKLKLAAGRCEKRARVPLSLSTDGWMDGRGRVERVRETQVRPARRRRLGGTGERARDSRALLPRATPTPVQRQAEQVGTRHRQPRLVRERKNRSFSCFGRKKNFIPQERALFLVCVSNIHSRALPGALVDRFRKKSARDEDQAVPREVAAVDGAHFEAFFFKLVHEARAAIVAARRAESERRRTNELDAAARATPASLSLSLSLSRWRLLMS